MNRSQRAGSGLEAFGVKNDTERAVKLYDV